jgi:hypothetical protein
VIRQRSRVWPDCQRSTAYSESVKDLRYECDSQPFRKLAILGRNLAKFLTLNIEGYGKEFVVASMVATSCDFLGCV